MQFLSPLEADPSPILIARVARRPSELEDSYDDSSEEDARERERDTARHGEDQDARKQEKARGRQSEDEEERESGTDREGARGGTR
jgi:hypothetical protein